MKQTKIKLTGSKHSLFFQLQNANPKGLATPNKLEALKIWSVSPERCKNNFEIKAH